MDSSKRTLAGRSRIDTRATTALIVTLLLWASAFAGIRAGLKAYSPGALVLLRFLVASFALLLYALIVRLRLPALRDLPVMFLLGLIGIVVYQVGLSVGEQSVSAGSASFLVASVPCFTALLSFIFLKERLRFSGWLGIMISFLGVAIISFGGGDGLSFTPGALFIVLASFSESIYFIIQKYYMQKYSGIELAIYTIWTATGFLLIFTPELMQQLPGAALSATLTVVYLGIFPAAIAYTTWFYTLSRMTASITTSFLNLSPLLAILISWIWLREIPTLIDFVGGIIVILGVLMVNTWGKQPPLTGER